MRYRNRCALYLVIALLTLGVFMLPSAVLGKVWGVGGLLYLGGSISYFLVDFLLLGKVIPLRHATPAGHRYLLAATVLLAALAIVAGLLKGNDLAAQTGVALVYLAVEFMVTRNEPLPATFRT